MLPRPAARALILLLALVTAPLPRSAVAAPIAPEPTALDAPADAARPWNPPAAASTDATRAEASFHGLHPLDLIRLHLRLGGFAEGALGGVDRDRGVMVLLEPGFALEVDLDLLAAVTPLGAARAERDEGGALLPEPRHRMDPRAVRYALRPTWRSHVGVVLSALLPGTGQFIQEDNRRVGWIFMTAWTFVVTAGVLALVVPSFPPTEERIAVAASFFGVGLGFNITAAIHAFQQGRRRVPIAVGGAARPTRRPLTGDRSNE